MKTALREAFERAKVADARAPLVKRLLRVMARGSGIRYARPRPRSR